MTALAFLLATPMHAHASYVGDGFESANKLYDEGKFSEADASYDKLISDGNVSAAIYFNRGNALFKLGQVGRAIASYIEAERLAPRDSDIRANLQFARTRARGGSPYHANHWTVFLGFLTLNEWAALTAIALWLFFLQLAVIQWQPDFKPRLRNGVYLAAFAMIFFAICLGFAVNSAYFANNVVVVSGEVEVRNGPLDEAPSVFKVRDGTELEVVDQKDNWYQVVDSSQRIGWLPQTDVMSLQPAAPNSRRRNS